MKMKNFMYSGALLAVIALSACSNDLDKNSEWGSNEVRFKSYIAGNVDTRVANGSNVWEDGDKVGIFMTKSGEALAGTQTAYTADSKGNLTAQGTALKFPDTGTADFYAYYPYADGLTDNNVPVDVTDQTKHIDLLYSKTADVASSTDAVNLGFKHQLTYVVLNITGNGIDASQVKVALKGTLTTGTFNLSDGTLTPAGSAADINFNSSSDGKTAAAIVLPATSVADAKLAFTLGDRTIEKALPVTSLNAGTKYTIPVTLTDGSISFGEATIADWTTGVVTGNVDVDFGGGETPTPPATEGDGTKAKPYSVAQAIAKQDGSKAWVTGYIVGYVNGADIKTGSNFNLDDTENISASNLLIAASADVKDYNACIPVQLKSGTDVRNAINLKDNSGMFGKSINIYGTLTKYFGVSGLKEPSAVIVDGKLIGTDPGDGGETKPTEPSSAPGTLTKAADLTDGTYAIGAAVDGTYQLMTNELKGFYGIATNWTSGEVPEGCQFIVKKSGNGFTIQGADSKYVYIQKNESHYNLKFDGDDTTTTWALEDTDNGVKAVYGTLTTNWLAYSTKFGNYTTAYSKSTEVVLVNFYKIK